MTKEQEWKTIESAPMDGGNYLVAVPYPEYNDYLIYIAYRCNGFWVSEETEGEIKPTHWMYLPETPKRLRVKSKKERKQI